MLTPIRDEKKADYDVFISYAGPDERYAKDLHNAIESRGRTAFAASVSLLPGCKWPIKIQNAQESSRLTAILLSVNTEEAFYQLDEIAAAIALHRRGRHLVVPVYLDAEPQFVPLGLRILHSVFWERQGGAEGVTERLIECLSGVSVEWYSPQGPIPGVASREEVFGREPPRGKVFASELLRQPIICQRVDGRIEVRIDRQGVHDAVYTTKGREWLCKNAISGDNKEWAEKKDKEIHAFFQGRTPDARYPLRWLHRFPLRWASGGVLSVIRIRGEPGWWSPFFFRDIQPIGWHMAIGASECEEELDDPWRFMLREFLEETLVLPGEPGGQGVDERKGFRVEDHYNRRSLAEEEADKFAAEHIRLRDRQDSLGLLPRRGKTIFCDSENTTTDLRIINNQGKEQPRCRNVLVVFNLLELGIEIIKVLRYELESTDYLLDGEILGGHGERRTLVRMPVALFSHKYLKRVFGRRDYVPKFEWPEVIDRESGKRIRVHLPAIRPRSLPRPGEMRLFDWDIKMRKVLASSKPGDYDVPKADIERHERWMTNFAPYFFDRDGQPSCANPFPLFTPPAAKILNYYFTTVRAPQ